MTAKKLHLLVLAFGACSAGLVSAGAGDITRRDAEGSVELSNLGEQEAAVVVAAPAASAKPAPGVGPASAAPLSRPMQPRTVTKRTRLVGERDDEEVASASPEGAETAQTPDGATAATAESGGQAAATSGWAAQQPFTSGTAGGVATGTLGGLGSGTYAGTPAATSGTSGTTGESGAPVLDNGTQSNGTQSSGTQNSGTQASTGAAQVSSVLDSPELLAQRLAQYRQLMLNGPLGPNGLAANPAVQRRYLMINRAGYWGNYR